MRMSISRAGYCRSLVIFALALVTLLFNQTLLAQNTSSFRQGGQEFEVTITNITAHQTFTPIIVATHREDVRLFMLGEPASVELEDLAESGNVEPLAGLLGASAGVRDIEKAQAPLPPGQSLTFTVSAGASFDKFSVAAMLVPTNDAFFALNGADIPSGNSTKTFFAVAYDAGTEFNDEDCDTIPGPPMVCAGEGFNPSRANAEGFVHVHRGIHGIGDISAARYDWRNPVAKIVIKRVRP